MEEHKFSPGHMFVPENKTYGDIMRYNRDIVNNFMNIIIPYAEKACGESIQDDVTIIADYCAADGQASLSLIQNLIGLIREKSKQSEILVVYEDYTGNDYNALFRQVMKGISTQDTSSSSGIFVMASATTMYKQCLPSNSTQFIFCCQGLYYLSTKLCKVTTSMLSIFAKPEERLIYKKQAEVDWKLFLSLRSRELKPGGLMFIIPSCTKEYDIHYQLDIVLKSLLEDNIISEEESGDIHLSTYVRSEEELRKPFQENADEVKDLELMYLDTANHVVFNVVSGTLGREKASSIMEYTRTFAYNPIVDNLSKDRTIEEKEEIANQFFNRFLENFRRFTKDVHIDHLRLVIRKK